MKNNKGITIIEMIVSMALISIVLGFLLGLLVQLKKLDDKSLKSLEYEEKIALITKYIQDKMEGDNSCMFSGNLNIKCPDTDTDLIITTSNNSFSLKDGTDIEKYTFPNGAIIQDYTLKSDSNLALAKWTIIDDQGNDYLLEISYYKK